MKTLRLNDSIFLHIHQEEKFKDVQLRLDFATPFVMGQRAVRTVLSFLLSDTCRAYPTKQDVQYASDMAYGMELSASDEVRGQAEFLELHTTCINGNLVNESLLEAQFGFLHDFALEPNIRDGLFVETEFQECRKKASTAITMVHDDPMNDACWKADQIYGGLTSRKILPTEAEIEAVTNRQAVDAWKDLVAHARIDLYVLGDIEEKKCLELAEKYFHLPARKTEVQLLYPESALSFHELVENRSYSQSYLVQMYHHGLLYTDERMPAFMLGNGILGALPTSMLFQEVREKRSLCYSIASDNAVYDGYVRISTQMEKENIEEAEQLIAQQIQRLLNMDYPEEDLETARWMYINSWRSSLDNSLALLQDDFNQVMIPGCRTTSQTIERFQTVTKHDIAEAWKNLHLQVSYKALQED